MHVFKTVYNRLLKELVLHSMLANKRSRTLRISEAKARRKDPTGQVHLGRWLLENSPRVDWEPPSRDEVDRPIPFIDYAADTESTENE